MWFHLLHISILKYESPTGKPIMARGKLADKCRNMIYKGGEKCYIKKRKSENISSDIPEE